MASPRQKINESRSRLADHLLLNMRSDDRGAYVRPEVFDSAPGIQPREASDKTVAEIALANARNAGFFPGGDIPRTVTRILDGEPVETYPINAHVIRKTAEGPPAKRVAPRVSQDDRLLAERIYMASVTVPESPGVASHSYLDNADRRMPPEAIGAAVEKGWVRLSDLDSPQMQVPGGSVTQRYEIPDLEAIRNIADAKPRRRCASAVPSGHAM